MKTRYTLTTSMALAVFLTAGFSLQAQAGRGSGMGASGLGGQTRMAGQTTPAQNPGANTGQGLQTRSQMRDPASNTSGQPIQSRDRIHTPGTGTATTTPATAAAN